MNKSDAVKKVNLKRYFFDEDTLFRFVKFLQERATVIAPHKTGEASYKYKEVADPGEIVLNYPRTIQPLKKYFFPPKETLLRYDREKSEVKPVEIITGPRIFFGIHSYEMQAIKRLDYSFTHGEPESNYIKRRENSFFIGVSYKPDEYHFGKSVGIAIEEMDGFSLYLEPVQDGYLVFVVDKTGDDLLYEFDPGDPLRGDYQFPEKEFLTKIKYHYNRLPMVFEGKYNSPVWKKVAERCLGCGTCNLLCPTCYCFDVRDEVQLDDLNTGSRERIWDGCMLNHFAEVAGGENFRKSLDQKTRHRLYRKFKYITQFSGELFCVGCGRCTRYCPAKISIVDILNELINEHEKQQKSRWERTVSPEVTRSEWF